MMTNLRTEEVHCYNEKNSKNPISVFDDFDYVFANIDFGSL